MTRRSHTDRAAALQAIYAKLPTINCQGFCWDSCGPIQMTPTEHRTIEKRHHVTIPDRTLRDAGATCEALTMLRRCAVYSDRPLLCRLWGLLDILPCTYGCKPERYLTAAEGYELLAQAYELDGDREKVEAFRRLTNPQLAPTLKRWLAGQTTYDDAGVEVRHILEQDG